MLTGIHIRDFAIIDEIDLELDRGLTVLTGETGAGKSILVDALGLALGDRADVEVVRAGAKAAEIVATFDLHSDATDCSAARTWLRQQELDAEDECILRRVINREGRSRAFINGRPCTLQMLRTLGEFVADIHGQHEHQSLVRTAEQRAIVDRRAGHGTLVGEIASVYARWWELGETGSTLEAARSEREQRIDYLRFQVQELEALDLSAEEWESLEQEHQRQANIGALSDTTQQALLRLDGDATGDERSARSQLAGAQQALAAAAALDPGLESLLKQLDDAEIVLRDAVAELGRYVTNLERDPQRLRWLEERLSTIHELARKHRVSPEELPGQLERLRAELGELGQVDNRLEAIRHEMQTIEQRYRELSNQLSQSRRRTAKRLAREVTELMKELGMRQGHFEVSVTSTADASWTRFGLDHIEFLVSTNPGQGLKPLARVASGGELSRIGLAIQVAAADTTQIACLIFDEIDSGIGGRVAATVGGKLRRLGGDRQVLCVTHLPQVASQAHSHVRVIKTTRDQFTRTTLKHLDPNEQIEELARMLGGIEVTERTRAHARELIGQADK